MEYSEKVKKNDIDRLTTILVDLNEKVHNFDAKLELKFSKEFKSFESENKEALSRNFVTQAEF